MIDVYRGVSSRLLTTQVLAGFAQWVDIFLIFSIPSFLWNSSPEDIALIAACFGLPSLFLGPFIGAIVDRADPRKMAFLGAIARTILSLCIAFAPSFGIFAIFVVLKGLANICYWPSTSILTNRIVCEGDRIKYYSSLGAMDQITKVMTPMFAGAMIYWFSSQKIFLASALATLLCAHFIYRFPDLDEGEKKLTRTTVSIFRDLLFGFKSIRELPRKLIATISLSIGMSLTLAIYDPHLASFLNWMNLGSGAFSAILTSTACGAIFGATMIRFFLAQVKSENLVKVGMFIFAFAIVSFFCVFFYRQNYIGLVTLAIFWFLNGMGYEIFAMGCSVNMQNFCPPALLGRITTTARSLQMLAVVSGPSLGAYLIEISSRFTPFIVSGALSVVLLFFSIVFLPQNEAKNFARNEIR